MSAVAGAIGPTPPDAVTPRPEDLRARLLAEVLTATVLIRHGEELFVFETAQTAALRWYVYDNQLPKIGALVDTILDVPGLDIALAGTLERIVAGLGAFYAAIPRHYEGAWVISRDWMIHAAMMQFTAALEELKTTGETDG